MAAVIAVAILIGGGIWWLILRLHPATDANTLLLYGNVDIREVQPAFNDTGAVTQMKVFEGAMLKKGELIATIDDSRYAAGLAQARQQADSLKATLARLVNGSRPEEIAQAKATMEGLRSIYDNNSILYERTVGLVPRGAASAEDRDNALAQLNSSRQSYEAAQQAYLLAVKGPRAEDIAAARTAHAAAEAAAALAEREFADTRLYAPADGIVEARILEPGDIATPATPVYTIALNEPLWVRAYAPEGELGRIHLGMSATVSTDSYPGHVYHGWIGYLSPSSEFTPKSVETPELRTALVYQLRVYVCDARNELRLGMPATVRIDLNRSAVATTPGCGSADATSH
jgi:HlyD family secretion protein